MCVSKHNNDKKEYTIMKTLQTKLMMLLFAVVAVVGCVNDDEFSAPDLTVEEPTLNGDVITIDALVSLYTQELNDEINDLGINPNDTDAIEELRNGFTVDLSENGSYISGFVISSDEQGNFFEEIVIQSTAANANAGVRVLIDDSPLFTSYEFGRKVFVKLGGLHFGDSNGVLTLGVSAELEKIAPSLREDYVVRSPEVVTIEARPVAIGDFSEALENTYVMVSNVQFRKEDVVDAAITYAGEATDQFDGERILSSCDTNTSTILSTSTFATFKSLELPAGRGNVSAVLTRNFFGDTFNLAVNSNANVVFDSEDRCDPEVLECTGEAVMGANTVFIETFESINDEDDLDGTWTNVNVTGGTERFELDEFSGNQYLRMSGFNTDEDPLNVWLVTPAINLDGSTDEALSFDVQAAFDNGKILSAFITTSYTGDPLTTEWTQIDANIPSGPSGGFGNFENSGLINIDCLDGDLHVGFLYEGADPGATTRYHIDNVRVTGN